MAVSSQEGAHICYRAFDTPNTKVQPGESPVDHVLFLCVENTTDGRPSLQTPLPYAGEGSAFSLPPPGPCLLSCLFQSCLLTEGWRLHGRSLENEQGLAPIQVTPGCSVSHRVEVPLRAFPMSTKSQKPPGEQGPVRKPQPTVTYLTRAHARKVPSEECK